MKRRHAFFFYTQKKLNELKGSVDTNFPEAFSKDRIPGLDILDDFITSEEENILF